MQKLTIWMLLLYAFNLAGCKANANKCVGWQEIELTSDAAVYLASNDTKAGKGIASHNQCGKKQAC